VLNKQVLKYNMHHVSEITWRQSCNHYLFNIFLHNGL